MEEREARNARTGRHDVARARSPRRHDGRAHRGDGQRAGTVRGFQSGTLVDPAHRGHRLGLAIKLANHRRVRARTPTCRLLLTGNAGVNAPMNAVNDALGYREIERCVEMQKDV